MIEKIFSGFVCLRYATKEIIPKDELFTQEYYADFFSQKREILLVIFKGVWSNSGDSSSFKSPPRLFTHICVNIIWCHLMNLLDIMFPFKGTSHLLFGKCR